MKSANRNNSRLKTERPLTTAERAVVADLVADGMSIQDKFRPEPFYKQTGKGHYASNTVEEIRRARKSKAKEDKP